MAHYTDRTVSHDVYYKSAVNLTLSEKYIYNPTKESPKWIIRNTYDAFTC